MLSKEIIFIDYRELNVYLRILPFHIKKFANIFAKNSKSLSSSGLSDLVYKYENV